MNSQMIPSFFIIISIFLNKSNASLCQQTIEYIDGKLRNSKVEIAKKYIQDPDPVTTVTYNIEWDILWTRDLCSQALTIGLSNKLFILMESDRVMSIGVDLNPPDQFTSTIHDVSILRSKIPMKFIKSITWKGLMYLLICYDSNYCNIYTSAGTLEFHHQQRTRHDMGKPIDANFFIDEDQLYLVISTNLKSYPSPSVIYRWTGTYMDVISEILLKSVISVGTFIHKASRFLVFSQSSIGSQIYKLTIDKSDRGYGHLEVIQFLPTIQPVGIHLYPYNGCTFLLVVNEAEPSQVFWWDGTEFLPWMQVEDIQGYSLLNTVQMANDTFFFVAQGNLLNLYKVTSLHYEYLKTFEIPNVIRIIDLGVWIDDNKISVVLISEKEPNCYRIEPLQLFVNKLEKYDKSINDKSDDKSEICFQKLEEKLKKRMEDVEVSSATWGHLYSVSEDAVIDRLEADVIIRSFQKSTSIESLEIISNTSGEIIAPEELKILMQDLESKTVNSLNKSKHLITIDGTTKTLTLPSLIIKNEAICDDLDTFALETEMINDEHPDEHFRAISVTSDEAFDGILRGNNVTIHNVEVESLCGVPREFWLLKNESKKTPLKPISGPADLQIPMVINNDTVSITSDIFLPKFVTNSLNSVNLTNLLDNLFILGENQVINGDVIFEHLSVDDLILEKLNGVSNEELLTMTTDQYVNHSVSIDSLDVQHLYVNKINRISLSEAARVSEENVIKGKVIVNHLKITDELIVNDNCDLFENAEHVQVYDDVTIIGSITIKRLQLENQANVQLEGLNIHGNDVDRLFMKSWTKSTDQTIQTSIIAFENGLTIDELNTEYLNGIRENEYLYTTVENINPEFGKLHFDDFFVNGTVHHGNQTRDFIEITDDTLVFNEKVFFKELTASKILTTRYNGIPINMINDRESVEAIAVSLPDDLKFEKIVVSDNLQVNDIHLRTLNGRNVSKLLFVDQNHKVETVKTTEFKVSEYRSSSFNYKVPRAASEFIPSELMDIIIQGPLIVEDNLYIEKFINDQSVDDYLNYLSKSDIRVNDPDLVLNELNVIEDVTIYSLQNVVFDKFVKGILSKSKDQKLTGTKSFHRVTADNVQAFVINGKKIEEMYLINDSLVFEDDVTFTNLSADIETITLNGLDTKWIQKDLSYILSKNITHMNLTGTVTWGNSESPKVLSDIIKNVVKIDNDEILESPVDFSEVENLEIVSLYTEHSLFSMIGDIIADAVLDDNNSVIEFSGTKNFLRDIEVIELIVDDLEINQLNTTTVRDLNASIVRKFEDIKVIDGTCIFTDEAIIFHLETLDFGAGMPNISSLFVLSDNGDHHLPSGTHFNHLMIRKSAEVFSLDGVNFDQFLKERVTLTGDHVIQSNVRFNGHINILSNVEVETINGITVSDIVLKDSVEPQVLNGAKTFLKDLIVKTDVRSPLFNGVNIIQAYNDGVLNEEIAVINGNLIIEGKIELSQDMTVSGRINGLKLSSILQNFEESSADNLEMIQRNMTAINALITNLTIIAGRHLPQFHHFEVQQHLETPEIHTVSRIIPVVFGNTTKLNVYGTQSGKHCPRLPEDCQCRSQYIIELSEHRFVSRQEDNSVIVFIFQETDLFTINVATTTVSTSSRCSLNLELDEFTSISWMARNNSSVFGNFTHHPKKIFGYLSDVQVFVHLEAVYIVLGMSYDVQKRTHQVDSLIYKLDLQRNELNLVLRAPVRAASAVEVFKIPGRGSHILITAGSDGDPQEPAKSLLYRVESNGREFQLLRSFYSGETRRVKSLAQRHQDFIMLDDTRTKTVHIYEYKKSFDNFYLYQSLHFDCGIRDIEIFYAGKFRWSDAYLLITTEDSRVFLYRYMIVGMFQERMSTWVRGALAVTPLREDEAQYLLLTRRDNSSIYRIVSHG